MNTNNNYQILEEGGGLDDLPGLEALGGDQTQTDAPPITLDPDKCYTCTLTIKIKDESGTEEDITKTIDGIFVIKGDGQTIDTSNQLNFVKALLIAAEKNNPLNPNRDDTVTLLYSTTRKPYNINDIRIFLDYMESPSSQISIEITKGLDQGSKECVKPASDPPKPGETIPSDPGKIPGSSPPEVPPISFTIDGCKEKDEEGKPRSKKIPININISNHFIEKSFYDLTNNVILKYLKHSNDGKYLNIMKHAFSVLPDSKVPLSIPNHIKDPIEIIMNSESFGERGVIYWLNTGAYRLIDSTQDEKEITRNLKYIFSIKAKIDLKFIVTINKFKTSSFGCDVDAYKELDDTLGLQSPKPFQHSIDLSQTVIMNFILSKDIKLLKIRTNNKELNTYLDKRDLALWRSKETQPCGFKNENGNHPEKGCSVCGGSGKLNTSIYDPLSEYLTPQVFKCYIPATEEPGCIKYFPESKKFGFVFSSSMQEQFAKELMAKFKLVDGVWNKDKKKWTCIGEGFNCINQIDNIEVPPDGIKITISKETLSKFSTGGVSKK